MAYVSSTYYSNEAQFYEAIERAKSARSVREEALKEARAREAAVAASFQEALASSMAGQAAPISSGTTQQTNAESLDTYFQQAAEACNISADLLRAVARQESNFTSDIVSKSGAVGVMQLMPATAAYLGVTNPYDAGQNIMGGAKLLSELSTRYNGNLDLTLAAYNAGAGAVDSYGGVPPFSETQNFVAKIKSYLELS